MKVVGVAWKGFAVPFRRPYVTSEARATTRFGLLLFLRTDNGLVGIGEASPVGAGSRPQLEAIAAGLERLAPRLLQMDLAESDAWHRWPHAGASPALCFGIETALLDVIGKAQGRSVASLIGGKGRPLKVNALISAETPEEAVAEAKEALRQGFVSLKLKVGSGTLKSDERLVAEVRRAVGPLVRLRIDPNQAWSVSQAIEAIERMAQYDLEYVEQPTPARDLAGLAEVRRRVSVPIAADEAFGSTEDLLRLVQAEAADLFILKAARLGMREAMEAMAVAEKLAKPLVVTSSLESGVGIAASAHLAAVLPSHPFAHGLATLSLLEADLLAMPLLTKRGTLVPPQGPGLGVSVDERGLDRYDIGISGSAGSWQGLWRP